MKTEWIDLSADGFEGVRVELRVRRSWAGQQRVDGARTIIRDSEDGTKKEATANFLGFGIEVFKASIVSWEGVLDESGRPLPVSTIGWLHDDFDPDLGDAMVDRLEAFYVAQSEARGRSPESLKTAAASSTES